MSRCDLFTWSDEAEAAKAAAEAEEARALAVKKALCAPHGALQARRALARQATLQALQAEVELARIQRSLR